MARQRGGLDPGDTSAIIGLVIFLLVAGLAIGLGVYFGTKKPTQSGGSQSPNVPPMSAITHGSTQLPGNNGQATVCPSSISVTNTQIQNPTSSSPSLVVHFDVSPSNLNSGNVTGNYSDGASPWVTAFTNSNTGSITFQFTSQLTTGWHNGTVELTYGDSRGCRATTTQPVSFFA